MDQQKKNYPLSLDKSEREKSFVVQNVFVFENYTQHINNDDDLDIYMFSYTMMMERIPF